MQKLILVSAFTILSLSLHGEEAAKAPAKGKGTPAVTNAAPAKSVFEATSSTRNPFAPGHPTATASAAATASAVKAPQFTLNGVAYGAKPLAMVNGRSFEAGEEGEVKVAGGTRIRIKCLDIRQTGASIMCNGQRIDLTLRD